MATKSTKMDKGNERERNAHAELRRRGGKMGKWNHTEALRDRGTEGEERFLNTKGTKQMECVRGREAAQWMGEWKWRE